MNCIEVSQLGQFTRDNEKKRKERLKQCLMVNRFIKDHKSTPEEIVLDIDGWNCWTLHGSKEHNLNPYGIQVILILMARFVVQV